MQPTENAWTIGRLIEWTQQFFSSIGIEEARLEAEVLLAHALGLQRIELYMHYNQQVDETERRVFKDLVRARGKAVPSQYLIGHCEFMSLVFKVTPACLIPRPETELLVELALQATALRDGTVAKPPLIADLCTGCGCVAVAIAANLPEARILATDISADAISVARENAEAHGLEQRVEFFQGDLFAPLADYAGKFDLIVANPPYISEAEYETLPAEIRLNEPREALVAGPEGTEMHRRIIADAPAYVKTDGILLMEIGANQGADVLKSVEASDAFTEAALVKDYSGKDRVLRAVRIG